MTNRLLSDALTVSFGGQPVLESLSVSLPDRQVTTIIGPNGCGKSTLLRSLARLQSADHGQVLLDGTPIQSQSTKAVARKLAMLPQVTQSPAAMRVDELVLRGRTPHQSPFRQWSQADADAVEQALEQVGLLSLRHRRLSELSGGQRQRAWIAMTLAQDTGILLLDEPTTYLDMPYQIEILSLVRSLCDQRGLTIAMVLHDINLAARFSDHIIAMRDGAVVASGSPDAVVTPAMMQSVFALDCVIIDDPIHQTPHIIPR